MTGLKFPREWEDVNSNTRRLIVPGGWIVQTTTRMITADKVYVNSEALVYVSDKDRRWVLENP